MEVSWLNQVEMKNNEVKIWKSVAVMTSITVVILGLSTTLMVYKVLQDFKKERLILVPAIQRKLVIPAQSYISESFVRAATTRIVELQEQWSYDTIEDHYKELVESFYDHRLSELTKANLISSRRFDYVQKNKMISTFKFDFKRSQFGWCQKLGRACAMVVGSRSLYINHNEPYATKEVAYFLLANNVWPTESHPFALKFTRAVIDDSSDNPYLNIKKQYDAALEGVLNHEN